MAKISFNYPSFIPLILLFFFSCSSTSLKQSCPCDDYRSVELTEQSLCHFADHLTGGPTDPLVIKFQENITTSQYLQKLCSKYLIGSVILFGKASDDALGAIHSFCADTMIPSLSSLIHALTEKNDRDSLVHCITGIVAWNRYWWSWFEYLLLELMAENWNAMKAVTVEIVSALKNGNSRRGMCVTVLEALPTGQRYELINTEEIFLKELEQPCCGKPDLLLMEPFALARCYHPDSQLRNRIVRLFPCFKQFLPDCVTSDTKARLSEVLPASSAVGDTAASLSSTLLALNHDAWTHLSTFLDLESLAFVLRLVCKSWRNICSDLLINGERMEDFYLRCWGCFRLGYVRRFAPWKHYFSSEAEELKYFERCLINGALDRAARSYEMKTKIEQYLEAVTYGDLPLPQLGQSESKYKSFLDLFTRFYEFYPDWNPYFAKPIFFTNEQYLQAIDYFVYEKKWNVWISSGWLTTNLPRIFSNTERGRVLATVLINQHFKHACKQPSIALIIHGQENGLQKELAELVFSRTDILRKLVKPKFVDPSSYYEFVVESDILSRIVSPEWVGPELHRFLVSLILAFKGQPTRINRILVVMNRLFSDSRKAKLEFEADISELLRDTSKCPPESAKPIMEIAARYGWWISSKPGPADAAR